MEPVRVGFIGCGRHATKMLYPSLHLAGLKLVAVCDLDETKARRNAGWFGAERFYGEHGRMLEQESLQAVLVCTSPATHAGLVSDCLARGLPVFVEKPPALNLEQAEALLSLSQRTGIPVMVGTMKRHALVYRRVQAIIQSPAFGGINAVQARMAVGWKNGNGYALLLDMGIHMLDLLRFLVGEVAELSYYKTDEEITRTSFAITLRFASGAVGTLFLSDQHLWERSNERVEISGQGQFVVAENLTRLEHYLPDGTISSWEPGWSIPNDENLSQFIGGYAGELQCFADSIRQGTAMHADLEDACQAFRLIKQIEPEEAYIKGPQKFTHWQSENAWLL